MPVTRLLNLTEKFEIEIYKSPKDIKQLKETHVPFTGAPQKHPTDHGKVVLVLDPCSTNTLYYEFKTDDISFVEDTTNLVNLEGEVIPIVRIWVQKKSVGVRCTPFIVEDIVNYPGLKAGACKSSR